MFAKVVARRSVGKFHKTLLVVLALIVLFATLPLGRAYAWSYGPTIGRRGAVSLPKIYIGDLLMPYGIRQLTIYGAGTNPRVYRSPASTGSQVVGAQYRVEKWNGSAWVVSARSQLITRTITATQTSVQFPHPYIQPVSTVGTFRFTWHFAWSTPTGQGLGATAVVSNVTSDHVCVTPYRLCQTFPGYFRTGPVR